MVRAQRRASKFCPCGVAVDGDSNIIVADSSSHRIQKVTPGGAVSTLAGSGNEGCVAGQGPAVSFNYPAGVAVDGDGNIIVADSSNHRIRKVATELTPRSSGGLPPLLPSAHATETLAMFNDTDFADVFFVVGGAEIPAHRVVLAARSEYFRAMLTGRFLERG